MTRLAGDDSAAAAALDLNAVPMLQPNFLREDVGPEAVVWPEGRADAVALDPAATVMLDVVDGSATIGDLIVDVQEVVGLSREVAEAQVRRVLRLFADAGILASLGSDPTATPSERELFVSPLSACMETSSCTGSVTPVNLEIGGTRLRVACTSRRLARRLRRALDAHVITEPAPLGFMIRSPRRGRLGHSLVDRCGFSLGEAQRQEQALSMIGSHLSALLPPPDGTLRLRVRALVKGDNATLVAWPLLFVQSIQETEIAAAGYAMVDRLAMDIDLATNAVRNSSPPWALGDRSAFSGHSSAGAQPLPIVQIAVAAPSAGSAPSSAQAVALLASELLGNQREAALRLAHSLIASDDVRLMAVDPYAPGGLLPQLAS